ncbi:hypothetical protein Lepto7376_2541 [[Leptolyngbya] sp. PCC 7376]|uniref:hypothetical protein n=1 Tax=[Leptolyngbya] sp. PCC 7376 TaxID=111781 RepID=UPI00029F2A4C|nr:hypothetical protein [[Leptolyngbya] sp. PCC 7376]AFY38815.1 hypothetical protein Lepto7376_2541 [[Leptolyngbya] sp. PCC 7376]
MDFPDSELEMAIADAEQELESLKLRYKEVCDATAEIAELRQSQLDMMDQPELVIKQESIKTELSLTISRIQDLELKLESKLLKWQEPFWQIVRFTGIGILIGWILRTSL